MAKIVEPCLKDLCGVGAKSDLLEVKIGKIVSFKWKIFTINFNLSLTNI